MSGRSPPIIDRLLQTKIFNFPNKKDYYPFIWIKVLKFKMIPSISTVLTNIITPMVLSTPFYKKYYNKYFLFIQEQIKREILLF